MLKLGFWEKILDSIAKKFDSILNKPFENKFTWSLFALGSTLISGSAIYGFTAKAKAQVKYEDYNVVIDFVSGPEIIPTIIGAILVGFSIAIFWKTKISKVQSEKKTEFDKMVEAGIDNFEDFQIEKAFKMEFNYLPSVKAIKLILKMNDSLAKFLDYKKAISHLTFTEEAFIIKSPTKLNLVGVSAIVMYFIFAFIALGSMQLIIWSVKSDSTQGILLFSFLACCFTTISVVSLNSYSETAAARRLANSA